MVRSTRARFAAAILCLGLAGSAQALSPTPFASLSTPIGVHATSTRMLLTQYCVFSQSPTLFQVDSAGVVTPFAPTLPVALGCVEKYLDISPGLGGFPRDFVYAIQDQNIWEISPDGSQVRLFATLPESAFDHNGLTFDRVGTFGHRLIATTLNGSVYLLDSTGTVTPLANVGTFHENPEVVPVGFGPYGGWVWTGAEQIGAVLAVSPAGQVAVVAGGLPGAETVSVVPKAPCTFGASGGAFFVVSHAENLVIKYPPEDFAGLGGDVLVAGEINLTWRIGLDAPGGQYTVSVFDPTVRHHEGATFARCPVVKPVAIDVKPGGCPNPVNAADRGVVPVALLGAADLDLAKVDVASLRLQGLAPLRAAFEDVASRVAPPAPACACTNAGPDGLGDLVLHFDARSLFATLGPVAGGAVVTVTLTGRLLDGTPIEGQDCVVVVR